MSTAEHRFDGQVALITGSGAGLGLAHARLLAERGAKVVINDISSTDDGRSLAEIVSEQLRDEGLTAVSAPGNVGAEAESIGLVRQTVDAFGRIDILVNNAGAGGTGTAQEVSTESFVETLNVHLLGTFWTMREALRHMRGQGYGRIVNTTSALGVFGAPGSAPYVTAKAGVVGLTKAASLDNRDLDIRINALAPVAATGYAKAYFEKKPDLDVRYLQASIVSPVMAYLSHASCELTGQTLAAGGGRAALLFSAAVPGLSSRTLSIEEVVAGLDQVTATEGFRILDSSVEQYDLLPRFGD
ncbi:SDR family NAD(P)-dependent oxidoreductase (plasmid) [Rhodococcus erythropolis]|uniref:SDR family NAD(P)-dependent oxidoreductase n=1 Tax=Rhodococcus TaxID=1827 RepID=UPI001244241F|nr:MULTISPECIES: SDR family NAD(P)-dependent oxidoreductase [Rhodococcus]MCJ0949869.1 SDR family NAD(P)-dependent oxidoreductase [Rhodococcus sp. ARC_M8]MCQ4152135.1 SDR family NAD(P)-dependent oxidoreductase [Rhodococcus qingshengii]MDJ0441261.1 SDR family NAD(P)-dependent oxidoreductase [Rhodococcus qingshengii]QEX08465.1 SDR family NAD(P)-dependent oxidoreductase [Rhodococcus erythropolis]